MTAKKCGCSSPSCGCCEGTRKVTPVSTANRPGLDSLIYRIGTHGAFFETMKARLGNMAVEAPGVDGQTIETFYPLQSLTTRDTHDPSIALLDGWASVGDVLTFYQGRIANEGYLRTATERRSILELARLVGYKLRPGVAATVFLAYTLEDAQVEPVDIPAGARSQSIPGPGEQAQAFETSESLIARREWNNLQVRLQRPQNLTLETALTVQKLYVGGANVNLKTGDVLQLVFSNAQPDTVVRTVTKAEGQFDKNRTEIELEPVPLPNAAALPALRNFVAKAKQLPNSNTGPVKFVIEAAIEILNSNYLGQYSSPTEWSQSLMEQEGSGEVTGLLEALDAEITSILRNLPQPEKEPSFTEPSEFIQSLLKPKTPQAASSLQLGRKLNSAFEKGADLNAQLIVSFASELKDNLYVAWSNAKIATPPAELKGVHVFRTSAPLFGASAAKLPTFFETAGGTPSHFAGQMRPQDEWDEWDLANDESENALFLDQAHKEILKGSYVLIDTRIVTEGSEGETISTIRRQPRLVTGVQTAERTAYGISGTTTQLQFLTPWWSNNEETKDMETLRATIVHAESEELAIVEEPITEDVFGSTVLLSGLYNEIPSGRWVIFSGERTDIPNVTGVKGVELLMVAGLRQVDPVVSGDKVHTALLLVTPAVYSYKRDTLTIYGNVVKGTHGETTNETLGSGDGSQAMQSFVLKQPPLTFVPAPTAEGVESTLQVYVNNVEWHEADSLAGLEPRDRKFTTKTDDADNTTVIFGNGKEGARLPTGVLNVNATYRRGIGKGGNVRADQISLLQTKPLGVKSVINPQRASGGADREDRDQARENAPLAVMALDRLVSVQDYSDFTRTFAGIAKASGRRLSDGRRQLIHLTVAGVDDVPIDPESDLRRNLLAALRNLGDLSVAVQIEVRELIILVLSANIRLQPDYLWDPVATAVREELVEKFGFRKRSLGQPARLCEIIGCIQSIEGVDYVDVDAFGGIPEKIKDASGKRRLQTFEELAETVQKIVSPAAKAAGGLSQFVPASLADVDGKAVKPAQLAIFTPAIQDTIVLNQIK